MPGQREKLAAASKAAARRLPTKKALLGRVIGETISSKFQSKRKQKREDELLDKKFEMEKKLMGLRPRAAGKPYTPVLDAYQAAYIKNLDKYEDDDAKAVTAANAFIKRTFSEDQVRRESQKLHSTIFDVADDDDDDVVDQGEGLLSRGAKAAGRGLLGAAKANLKYNPLVNPAGAIRGVASLLKPQSTQFAPPSNIPAMGAPPNALAAPPQPALLPPGAQKISPEEFKLLVESGKTPEQIRAEGFIVGR